MIIKCPYCDKKLEVEDGVKTVKCEKCYAAVEIKVEKPKKEKTTSNEAEVKE